MKLACNACRVSFTMQKRALRGLAEEYDAVACPRCGAALPLSLVPAYRVLELVDSRITPGADPPGLHEAARRWNEALGDVSSGGAVIERHRVALALGVVLLGIAFVVFALHG